MKHNVYFFAVLVIAHHLYSFADISAADTRALSIQSDSKIMVAGTFTQNKQNVFGCARYLTNGILDTNFGDQGIMFIPAGDQAEINAITIQQDGKIIIGGFFIVNDISKSFCARLTTVGSLDSTFGQNGIVIENSLQYAQIADLKMQLDGKIVACGTCSDGGQLSIFLFRYNTDGTKDSSFGNEGVVTLRLGYHTGASALAIQPDNKILVTGFNVSQDREVLLVRYNHDGTIDEQYGQEGMVVTPNGSSCQAEAILLDENGNTIIAGTTDNKFLISRYLDDGSLDSAFGSGGLVVIPVGIWASAFGVALQSDGKIMVVGYADQSFAVIRLNDTGSLDTSFNNTGIVTKLIANNDNCARAVGVDSVYGIYVAGSASNSSCVVRLNTQGSFDTNWGGNGIVTYPTFSVGNPLTIIADFKQSGTNGGTFTAGQWITRDLNQIITSSSNIALHENYFTLQQGIYDVSVFAPAYMCGNHKIRLQNITDNITESHGVAAYSSPNASTSVSNSFLELTLIVDHPTDYEVQHRCSVSRSDDGFGVASAFDETEVYTSVKIIEK
jgi:uncharacterized delta-60 repeat protein